MESLDGSEIVHCGHEPLAVPRRTESADKSDTLQTLRAGQVSGRRVSVWSACVFSAAFPRPAAIRCPVMVHENTKESPNLKLQVGSIAAAFGIWSLVFDVWLVGCGVSFSRPSPIANRLSPL